MKGEKYLQQNPKARADDILWAFENSDIKAIIANINFGHTSPICILPYGAQAEIDFDNRTISILESGVI